MSSSNHGILATDPRGRAQGPSGGEFIDRYVFPGGEVPHLSRPIFEVARARLEPVDIEDLRPQNARTLRHWVERLEAHRDEAIRTAGAERYRICPLLTCWPTSRLLPAWRRAYGPATINIASS